LEKKKRFRGRVGFRPSYKKASVRLATGDSIDLGLKV
jgi:ribosomal protein L23